MKISAKKMKKLEKEEEPSKTSKTSSSKQSSDAHPKVAVTKTGSSLYEVDSDEEMSD